MLPGFHFSSLNHAMVSQNPCDSLNLFWNQQMEANKARMMMFMTPTFDASIGWQYPEFGIYGNNLMNPALAIQQCMNAWQNNGMNFNFQFPGMNGGSIFPWQNNIGATPGSGNTKTDAEREAEQKTKDEIKYLTIVLKELKDTASEELDEDTLRKIDIALKKSSSKPNEKLESLQNAYKEIDKNLVKKVLPSIVDVKNPLYDAGFNFGNDEYSFAYKPEGNKVDDTADKVNVIEQEIVKIADNQVTCPAISGIQKDDVLRIISAWNDRHNDEEKNERSIIKAVNNQILNKMSDKAQKISAVQSVIQPFVNALISKSEALLKANKSKFVDLEKAMRSNIDALNTSLTTVLSASEINKELLEDLETKFETVYLSARKLTALAAQKEVAKKYAFIDKIQSGTEDDVITDDLFKDATIEDLKKEGFNTDETDFSNFKLKETTKPAEKITVELLQQNGTKVEGKTVRNAKGVLVQGDIYEYKGKYYRIKGGNPEEIKDAKIEEKAE